MLVNKIREKMIESGNPTKLLIEILKILKVDLQFLKSKDSRIVFNPCSNSGYIEHNGHFDTLKDNKLLEYLLSIETLPMHGHHFPL